MADTLGTNTMGYSYPGATYTRKGVATYWDKRVMNAVYDKLILKPFIGGPGSGLPILRKQDLSKGKKGDTIRMYLEGILTGPPVWSNNTLEGTEDTFPQSFCDVYINQVRNAVKDDGEMSRQRDQYDTNSRFANQLSRWYREEMERYIFNAIYYGYDPHLVADASLNDATPYAGGLGLNSEGIIPARLWYCADSANNSITYSATAATYITNIKAAEQSLVNISTDWFGPEILEAVATLLDVNNVPEISYDGWTGYIGLIHPYQLAQLRANEKWFLANIHAMPTGTKGNPIFTGGLANGAVGMWNNIMLFKSNLIHSGNISKYTDYVVTMGGNATCEIDSDCSDVYRAIFLGAESTSLVEAVPPHILKKGDFDYNNKEGVAISGIFGAQRNIFTSDDSNATLTDHRTLIVSTFSPANTI